MVLVTGIILAPAAIATPAVQNLIDLRTIITAAATTIGDDRNPNLGFGFNLLGSNGQMGTADLVSNITATVLQTKYQLDTNKTSWLLPSNASIPSTPGLNTTVPTPFTPTLPLSSSIVMPSTLPTSLVNATTDLSTPYIDYVSSFSTLSTALTSLGRAWHREMNQPVQDAIGALQQSITALQTDMLQSNLISSTAIVRTIRASSSLENAQTAWGRFLNLPGSTGGGDNDDAGGDVGGVTKRQTLELTAHEGGAGDKPRPPPSSGRYYSHEELWGRVARAFIA